jgi:hypothetical protein
VVNFTETAEPVVVPISEFVTKKLPAQFEALVVREDLESFLSRSSDWYPFAVQNDSYFLWNPRLMHIVPAVTAWLLDSGAEITARAIKESGTNGILNMLK